jgi:hypothetical protein
MLYDTGERETIEVRALKAAGAPAGLDAVTIRRAHAADRLALARLAALDGCAPLAGDLLLAEIEGELWAALSLDDGRVVSDPFRPAAAVRALLLLRADHLAAAAGRGGRRWPALAWPAAAARRVGLVRALRLQAPR